MSQFAGQWPFIGRPLRASVSACLATLARCAGIVAMLSVFADASAQQNFGRLFFDAEERRMLDEMRNDPVEPQVVQVTPGEPSVAPVVDVISFDGKVERSGGGGSTIWVNGRPVLTGNRTVEGISIHSSRGTSGETRFELPPSDTGETNFSLKVGQKIGVQSGKLLEPYESRAAEDAQSVFAAETPPESDARADSEVPARQKAGSASGAP